MKQRNSHRSGIRRIGRRQALATLDNMMLSCKGREKQFEARLQAEFDKDPLRFFREIIMPLIPRTALAFRDPADEVKWQSSEDGKGGAR